MGFISSEWAPINNVFQQLLFAKICTSQNIYLYSSWNSTVRNYVCGEFKFTNITGMLSNFQDFLCSVYSALFHVYNVI